MDSYLDDREVQAAFERLHKVGVSLNHKLKPTLFAQLSKVQAEAQKKAPADGDRSLQRSARTHVETVGNSLYGKIAFGGLAAKYAEVQHENEDFAHDEPGYAAKYGKPLNRTHYTRQTLRGTRGKRGKITIKAKTWRYKRKHKITGYTGGQAHFLHGADNSAWNRRSQKELQVTVEWQTERIVEAAIEGKGKP